MSKRISSFLRSGVFLIFLVFPTIVFAEVECNEIESILAQAKERIKNGNPDFNDIMRRELINGQPITGNVLLEKIKKIDNQDNKIATIAFTKIWNSLTIEQIKAYFSMVFDVYTEFNDYYQVGDDAYIGMNYEVSPYEWKSIPKDANLVISTISVHFLDGKQNGKEFRYSGPLARTGYISINELKKGAHKFNWNTKYEIQFGDEVITGIVISPEYSFKIVDKIETYVEAIDPNKSLDNLLVSSLLFAQRNPDKHRNKFGENVYGQYVPNSTRTYYHVKYGVHTPGYTLKKPLPVNLCYRVETVLTQTGRVLKPDNKIIILAGETVWWNYLEVEVEFRDTKEDPNICFPIELVVNENGHIEYLNPIIDPNGFIPIKLILTPDKEMARISGIVENYYNKKIVINNLKIKIWDNSLNIYR